MLDGWAEPIAGYYVIDQSGAVVLVQSDDTHYSLARTDANGEEFMTFPDFYYELNDPELALILSNFDGRYVIVVTNYDEETDSISFTIDNVNYVAEDAGGSNCTPRINVL